MPFQLSPGVQVVERDFTSIVPAVSSSTGAFAGPFAWGPVEDPVRISSENELVARFGMPTDQNFASFFSAANFLAYTNSLFVSRTDAPGLRNAVAIRSSGVTSVILNNQGSGYEAAQNITVTFSQPQLPGGVTATGTVTFVTAGGFKTITGVTVTNPGSGYVTAPSVTFSAPSAGGGSVTATGTAVIDPTGARIKNVNDFLEDYQLDTGVNGEFAAKFPGARGNGITVILLDSGNWPTLVQQASTANTDVASRAFYASIKNLFTGAPGTSDYAKNKNIVGDELHVVILDTPDGTFSGSPNNLLEKYEFVSKLKDAKRSDGTNIFWKAAINAQSKYVWALGPALDDKLSIAPTNVVSGKQLTFSASAKTIAVEAITGELARTNLEAFKTFFDSAVDKTTRQIKVEGAGSNNGVYLVASITVSGNIFTITLASSENIVDGVVATGGIITSVDKQNWNQSSDQFASILTQSPKGYFRVLKGLNDIKLVGGVTDFASTQGNYFSAYDKFVNTEEYDLSLVVTGATSPAVAKYIIDNLVEVRKDCVAFISPNDNLGPITGFGQDATSKIIAYREAVGASTSYAVMDTGYKYQYDRYNDVYRWVPLNGDIAGLCARTDFTADPWFSPGGYTRGQIKNIIKLAFNPAPTDRDVLYPLGINPVVTFPGQGTVLFGDRTMLTKPSAFDRINVRRLFIVLEKSIATAAKFQLFEFNDSFTRAQFRNLVEPFLRDVQGRRGIVDFRVKCDESNNTGEVIDRNEFVADIFIKPNRSINFITLNFIAARSSVSFEEIGA